MNNIQLYNSSIQPLKGLREPRTVVVSYRALSPYGEPQPVPTKALSNRITVPTTPPPFRHTPYRFWPQEATPVWRNLLQHPRGDDSFTFSAKERDSETGLSYFGSRYYSSDLSIWLSVDPMSDKYPSLSPYVYCANNPVKLVDPNGEDWYEKDGEMYYTTQYTSKKAFQKSGIEGTYKGKFFTENGKYYSLFGQILDAESINGKLTQKIDEAFDKYAAYEKKCRQSKFSYPEIQSSDYTNFNGIISYVDRFGTTYENVHDYEPEEKHRPLTYAYGSTVRFTVVQDRAKMFGRFGGFASGNSKKPYGNGFCTKNGFHIYIVNGQNRIIGITFSSEEKLENLKNHFYKLYGL